MKIDLFGSWCNNYFDGIMTTNIANSIAKSYGKIDVYYHIKNFDDKHENVNLIYSLPSGGDTLIIQMEDVIGFTKKFSIDQFKKKYKKVYYHVSQCSGWVESKDHYFLVEKILNKVDGIICALNWDAEKAQKQGFKAFFGGRGADSNILFEKQKSKNPTVFLDFERGSSHCKHKEFRDALSIVKEKNENIKIGTFVKHYDISDFVVKWGNFQYMANTIYNPNWIFLPSHNGGYELPIIESQMAGCTICSFKDHVQEEILSENSKKYVSNNINDLANNILKAVDNFRLEKKLNREFTLLNHTWDKIASNWLKIALG